MFGFLINFDSIVFQKEQKGNYNKNIYLFYIIYSIFITIQKPMQENQVEKIQQSQVNKNNDTSVQDNQKSNNMQVEQKEKSNQKQQLMASEKQPKIDSQTKKIDSKGQRLVEQIEKQEQLSKQLLQMGFQPYLIEQAVKKTKDKEKAIQFIIACLEKEEQSLQKVHKNTKNIMQEDNQKKGNGVEDDGDFQDVQQQCKMVFLVRMDLKMGLGKIAAQVAHATLKAYKQMVERASSNDLDFVTLEDWKEMGQKKIVVKVNDQNELLNTLKKASQKGINNCYIRDAGLTQVASGSMTVGAIGPAPSSEIDLLTKCYKLL